MDPGQRLKAYSRAARASLSVGGAPRPPVLNLSESELAGIFAPAQLAALVPLKPVSLCAPKTKKK